MTALIGVSSVLSITRGTAVVNQSLDNRLYNRNHEWILIQGDELLFGITAKGQDLLGEIVFVELPQVGTRCELGKPLVVVESVKSVSDTYAPVGGEITAVNQALTTAPNLVNSDPLGEGWLVKIKFKAEHNFSDWMDSEQYVRYCQEGE